jgi:hypothetical protein
MVREDDEWKFAGWRGCFGPVEPVITHGLRFTIPASPEKITIPFGNLLLSSYDAFDRFEPRQNPPNDRFVHPAGSPA